MKRILSTIGMMMLCACTLMAQNPKWFKNAQKARLTLLTYDAQGNIRQGQAYYVDENGTAMAEYDLLKGAVRGTVVDYEGKEHAVTHILGASSLYNVARIQTDAQKTKALACSTTNATKGEVVYILPLNIKDKKATCTRDTVVDLQTFEEAAYPYYTLSGKVEERSAACPVLNEAGELIGHVQLSAQQNKKQAFVLGANYGKSLEIKAFDANNPDLRAIGIRKALPREESQAASYLYLMNRQDSAAYEQSVKDFMAQYPQSSTGYILLAEWQIAHQGFGQAEETYKQALSQKTAHEDEIHHSFAKALYQAGLNKEEVHPGWNMQRALEEAQAAYTLNPLPLYTALEGMALYALKRYEEACLKFLNVTQTKMRSAEYFMYAAQCRQMEKKPLEEVLALQDSAVNCYSKPYPPEASTYLYLRAQTLASLKRYREAVADMNEYEHLLSGNATAAFYYEREQMEMQTRMYQPALNDIERAVRLAPQEPLYRAEEAVVNYRVGQLNEAILAAREAIRLDNNFADAHRILGICLRDKGDKTGARKSLERAVELGDEVAKGILEQLN